jgi:hypothetical protein
MASGNLPDGDLDTLNREQLVAEVRKLRNAIRRHRDSSGHALCWHHPDMWALLPERTDPLPVVPDWPEFLDGLPPVARSPATECSAQR